MAPRIMFPLLSPLHDDLKPYHSMSPASPQESNALESQGLLPIAVRTLSAATLSFNLYVERVDGTTALYRERSQPLKPEDLTRLISRGIKTLYIMAADHTAYREYLNKEIICNEKIPALRRYEVLKEANKAVFEAAYRSGNVTHMVEHSDELGHQMADIICREDLIFQDLFSLMEHDYYTYTHAMNVCTYSLFLAKQFGSIEESELPTVATGGLLHDLGKRRIKQDVLNQEGPLTKSQWRNVQQHPEIGFQELCLRPDLSFGQLMMVYQHHERIDGSGYPVGLVGEEIHPWARICAIADVFHALTSDRSYRKAKSVEVAHATLEEKAGTDFDKDMVECWTETTSCLC